MPALIKNFIALLSAILMSLGLLTVGEIKINNVPEQPEDTVRIVSFNLRTANDIYGSVKNRSQFIAAAFDAYAPDSIGVQEANPTWLNLLDEKIGDRYARVGEPRDNSKNTEYSCVYYLKDKYELLDSGTIWLSKTPDVAGSKDFNSSYPRICTWATLRDKQTGLTYTHANTHLDHLLESTRAKQAEVLMSKIEELEKTAPVVLTGDFNANEGKDAYNTVAAKMDDSRLVAEKTQQGKTYHNYGRGDLLHTSAIDFIFVSKGTQVARYKIIDNTVEDMYLSDHYGLCADVYIK
ncbi:MAG: endonuclease/exonuclease/phosphatase family protein [Faecalibacterium sp.]|nr:endonuclease/exonuclease/phosphatase family protein [Ruminococcus sp.]MCM1391898.1 endonuclease/exonuclease/phosphatase family protein [Ruminococcus sp.]MCM1485628.1 endonuclease/exonuclease/phosphatase family protein [Faecalibacterium sp.]